MIQAKFLTNACFFLHITLVYSFTSIKYPFPVKPTRINFKWNASLELSTTETRKQYMYKSDNYLAHVLWTFFVC